MLSNWASLSNKHNSTNNWMHYEKKEFKKHNNNAENSIQGEKIGHQKRHYLEPESFLEVSMQQGIWGQGPTTVSCKAK
jgi:hypothetical protein